MHEIASNFYFIIVNYKHHAFRFILLHSNWMYSVTQKLNTITINGYANYTFKRSLISDVYLQKKLPVKGILKVQRLFVYIPAKELKETHSLHKISLCVGPQITNCFFIALISSVYHLTCSSTVCYVAVFSWKRWRTRNLIQVKGWRNVNIIIYC